LCAIVAASTEHGGHDGRENDPIQQAASAEIKRQEDPSSPVQLELRAPYRIAAELTRIRFEMTAIRKILQGRESIEVEELKRLQGRGNIEGGTF
jgi:hypothetical protein